jgi:hypothetical protein
MNVKIHYRITQDRSGLPLDLAGARHFVVKEHEAVEMTAKHQLATDFQVPPSAVHISRIET